MTDDDRRPKLGPAGTGTAVAGARDEKEGSPEAEERLKQQGFDLITHFFSSSKILRLYDMNNRATQRAIDELYDVVTQIFEQDQVLELRVANDLLKLNDNRIPVDARHYGPFEYVIEEMKNKDVGAIVLAPAITKKELGGFLKIFFEMESGENVYNELVEKLEKASIESVSLIQWVDHEQRLVDVDEDTRKIREDSNRVYFRTVALMGDILRTIEEKHILHVKKAKRLTQQMVDIIQTDESLLVGLSSIKNFDEYTFAHSVNVSILSMVVADRMQLDKADVARVGVCGLFHDIGKTYVPTSILKSTGPLTPPEWKLMKYHTIFGVKELSRIKSVRDAIDSMFVAVQHHVHYDMNGYPRRPNGWNLQLFSRIVTVADYYDAMTACRTYQKEPVTPDKALRFILEKSGSVFDPFISKIFIQAMGLYPIGTIVELDTGETAVVVRQNRDPRYIHRPLVEIIDKNADPSGERLTADLTERASGEYRFKRTVVCTIHDSEIDVDKRLHFVF